MKNIIYHLFTPLHLLFKADILFPDIIEITLQRLFAKKLRSVLTVMGIGIGIGAVYFLVSATFGIQKLVIGRIATSESLLSLDVIPNTEIKDMVKLNSKVISDITILDHVSQVSAVKSLPSEVTFNSLKAQTVVYGVDPSYFRLAGISASAGQLIEDSNTTKVVISSAVLSLFNLTEKNALGAKLNLSFLLPEAPVTADPALEASATASLSSSIHTVAIPSQLTIVGIINDDTNYIYTHHQLFDIANFDDYRSAKVKVDSQDSINSVRDLITAKGFMVSAMTDTLVQINQIFNVTQVTFTLIGIVALLIAAIGMLNTMTVSLLERTREIGIMKAIGATERGIQQMFLAESVLMGLGGGISGLILGFLFCQLVNIIVNILAVSLGGSRLNIFYTPPWFILLVVGFSLAIGFFTGFFPARRAARLNPLDALRYE